MEGQLKRYEDDLVEYSTPRAIGRRQSSLEGVHNVRFNEESVGKESLTDKYIQLENTINEQVYELFKDVNFMSLLEKYDVNNEKETLKVLNDELLHSEVQRKNYELLVEIKKNYNELIELFNQLNDCERDMITLLERIKQNDKKLLDSSLLNNQLISHDNNSGIFKSNDYLKLLLLDLKVLKKKACLKSDLLLEKEMITDMLNRNRVHFFTMRMNELLERHIEDIDTLNKKDEDSFYLESVLRKKVNHIHIENTQLKEQINRDIFLINKKDQEINKLSFTLFALQDQLDNSITHLRTRLKNKYGNILHINENNILESSTNDDTVHNNQLVTSKDYTSKPNIEEFSDYKEVHNEQNHNLNVHAHIRRHDYINSGILKGGAKLLRINNNQTDSTKDSTISGIEKKFNDIKSSIPSKLNILSQCKHIKSVFSTPRDTAEHACGNNLVITPVDTEHELIERVESDSHGESSLNANLCDKRQEASHCGDEVKDVSRFNHSSEVVDNINNKVVESSSNDMANTKTYDQKAVHDQDNKKDLESDRANRSNVRHNLTLQNYRVSEKSTHRSMTEKKCVQENESSNRKNLSKSGSTDSGVSMTNSREHISTSNDQLGSFSKPTFTSMSKKRTKSKERLSDYNSSSSNNMFRTNSKTNLIQISNLKGGIFDESYAHSESIASANILSKRNLRKTSNDLEAIVPKTKTTNLVNCSTFNISNKDGTVDKYLFKDKKDSSNKIETDEQPNNSKDVPIVRAYKATIQTIKSINDFQVGSTDKDSNIASGINGSSTDKDSFMIYSPEVQPLSLQPINLVHGDSVNSCDTNISRSNSAPLFNSNVDNNNFHSYSFNPLNTRSSSNYFSHSTTTLQKGNTMPSNATSTVPSPNNFQYLAPVPTPITVDTVQQRILFPNNFHALYK
ncbi:hypothetical protein OJ252_223 [Cryptosporidium canis]|uniref:Uncharacterized protein n=1 Tax=Cryptosporidium canis TaxID=195482 RepID=A0ABQ8PC79_9CRYT|nr:hypothetical protein OJ252_223 [Cryptosporidium canis]